MGNLWKSKGKNSARVIHISINRVINSFSTAFWSRMLISKDRQRCSAAGWIPIGRHSAADCFCLPVGSSSPRLRKKEPTSWSFPTGKRPNIAVRTSIIWWKATASSSFRTAAAPWNGAITSLPSASSGRPPSARSWIRAKVPCSSSPIRRPWTSRCPSRKRSPARS